ncbi:MAG: IPT/TIG domain-containing protein [Myxococcota bacterium]
MSGFVVRVALVLSLVASFAACGGGSGLGPDGGADPDVSDVGTDGAVETDVADRDVGPEGTTWEAAVASGGLAWSDPVARDLATRARRAHALGVQAVLAANALVYLDAAETPRDLVSARRDAARKALSQARTEGEALQAAVLAARPAPKADDPGGAALTEGPAPLALLRRDEAVLEGQDALGRAVVAEADRLDTALGSLLLPPDAAGIQAALDEARAALTEGARLSVALPGGVVTAGGVSEAPGFTARGLVQVDDAEAIAARVGDAVVLVAGGDAPLAGGPEGGLLMLRTDAGAAEDGDVPVLVTPVSSDTPAGVTLGVFFQGVDAATVSSSPLPADAPCLVTGAPCPLDPGAFPPGDYLGPGGVAFASDGLAGGVVGLLQEAIPAHERVLDLGTGGPPPVITGISPAEGPVGTSVTIAGSGFGQDPGRVTVSMNHGRLVHPTPTSVADSAVTFTVPSGMGPGFPYPYCAWDGEQGGLAWLVVGGVEAESSHFTLTGLPACPPSPFSAHPAAGVPGTPVRVEGYGFSPDPAKNLVDLDGVALEVEDYEPDTYLEQHRGTISFRIPEDTAPGTHTLRFRRTDGVAAWSTGVTFIVFPEDMVALGPGELAGGAVLPGRCWDAGLETQGCVGAQASWVLSGTNLHALVGDGDDGVVGHLEVQIDTPGGSFTAHAYAPTPDELVIRHVQTEWFAGTWPGDTISIRVSGREPVSNAEVVSQPIVVPVADALVPSGWARLSSSFELGPGEWEPLQLARGDVLVLVGANTPDIHELVAPGLWPGSLSVAGSCAYVTGLCSDLAKAGTPRTRHVVLDQAGAFTITNATTGETLDVEVQAEGIYGGATWPWAFAEPGEPEPRTEDAVAEGVVLACGGARLVVPPGALPLHDGSGAYRVKCSTAYAQTAPGIPQLTDGGWSRGVTFEPEPPKLLKPIRLILPFGEEGRSTVPDAALADPESGLYFTLPAQVDAAAGEVVLEIPAGTWPPVAPSYVLAPTGPAQPSKWPSLGLNSLLKKVKAVSWKSSKGTKTDEDRKLQVDWVSAPGATGYVTDAFADQVMATAQATWDTLTDAEWPKPDGWFGGWLVITVADLGPASEVKGSTTSGVFGQPWIKVNSNLAMGSALKTTVAHEVGHAFQRQLTTNLTLNWIDEASAGWVAWATLGSEADLSGDITAASEFPGLSLPDTFNGGYDQDQGYAAGAWAIWLESAHPGALLDIYQALSWSPSAWTDGHETLTAATGASLGTLVREFALAYWAQTYPPIDGLALTTSAHVREWKDWGGVSLSETRPPLSSQRFDVSVAPAFQGHLAGHELVVRVPDEDGAQVWVWGDPNPCAAPASGDSMTELAILGTLSLGEPLGTWSVGGFGCLRVLFVNGLEGEAAPGSARLCAPRIQGLSPDSGALSGGYPVTLTGTCFGPAGESSTVTVGGFPAAVTSWSDTSVTITMIHAGTSAGAWPVQLVTAEGATTQPVDFVFEP